MKQEFSTTPANDKRALLRQSEIEPRYGIGGAFLRKRRRLHLDPPFLRVGRSIYYRVSDLEDWLERCRVAPKIGNGCGGEHGNV